jgi:hypothetical protein
MGPAPNRVDTPWCDPHDYAKSVIFELCKPQPPVSNTMADRLSKSNLRGKLSTLGGCPTFEVLGAPSALRPSQIDASLHSGGQAEGSLKPQKLVAGGIVVGIAFSRLGVAFATSPQLRQGRRSRGLDRSP